MTEEQIFAKVKEILVSNFSLEAEKITLTATFRGGLGLDSLDIVDLIFFLQQGFGFKDTIDDYRDLHTVAKLVTYVHGKLSQVAP